MLLKSSSSSPSFPKKYSITLTFSSTPAGGGGGGGATTVVSVFLSSSLSSPPSVVACSRSIDGDVVIGLMMGKEARLLLPDDLHACNELG